MMHEPVFPPAAAVTVAVPIWRPVTAPLSSTMATSVSELLQLTVLSVASAGRTSATSRLTCPLKRVTASGVTLGSLQLLNPLQGSKTST